jgi:hypothetical protein
MVLKTYHRKFGSISVSLDVSCRIGKFYAQKNGDSLVYSGYVISNNIPHWYVLPKIITDRNIAKIDDWIMQKMKK